MKHLLEVIAKALVDQPDKVTVTEKETADAVVLELHVAEGDMGKVIGKQGRIAKAIRTVVKASVDKGDKKIVVDILWKNLLLKFNPYLRNLINLICQKINIYKNCP